jgi:hypothetical protein
MRRLRYGVAMSLDGFIAGPNGEQGYAQRDCDADVLGRPRKTGLIRRQNL